MTPKLCLLCCENFHPEVAASVAAEGWTDVTVASFPARCGIPPLDWDTLCPSLPPDCSQVVILGRACLKDLADPPPGWPPLRQIVQNECFDLVAGPSLVAAAIAAGAYIVTPGWLADWRSQLARLGLDEGTAIGFFHDFARELVLLDTGVCEAAATRLAELAEALHLPATRIAVGIDYTRLVLARVRYEWLADEARQQAREDAHHAARERADRAAAMDFLGQLAALKDETETVEAIKDLHRMLFAPAELHYLRFEGGVAQGFEDLSPELARQIPPSDRRWAWTESGTGFVMRLDRSGETLGMIVADRFAFPEFRQRYLDLALSLAGVCALAIENARTYRQMKVTEEALRRSEHSLKMAQAVAHVGHWEWEIESDTMCWSDETYRILGFQPKALNPSREAFFSLVIPDDRGKLADAIERCRSGDGFDLEFRIVLPDGRRRTVHCLGERLLLPDGRPPWLIATLREVNARSPEVLGIIQDITERKELEARLEQEARTDPLTGCANRRHFLDQADRELARTLRYGGELALLMLDLDHFKAVNDRHGHHVGDLTLKAFADVCRSTVRNEDLVGRLGGEEFAVLLPQTGADEALEAAERLSRAVAALELPVDGETLRFTVSVGVASLAAEDAGVASLLTRADNALYEAKRSGRNRVVVAGRAAATDVVGNAL